MDARRFDDFARSLSSGASRRGALAGLISGLLAIRSLTTTFDDATAESGKCKQPCGECERCDKGKCHQTRHGKKRCKAGKCRPKADGTACGSGGQICQGGVCACPSGTVACAGACVDTASDPRNCGSCGTRCPVNANCLAGVCQCVRGSCSVPNATCCPASGPPIICRCRGVSSGLFVDATTCADVMSCPAGLTPCVGAPGTCQACCPPGSTCDTATGSCLQ